MTLQASTFHSVRLPLRRLPSLVVRAKVEPSEKSVEIMRKFSDHMLASLEHTFVLINLLQQWLLRYYYDNAAEVGQGFWNCPCVPMRERKECHCMLFLTPENDFAGQEQTISLEEIKESTSGL